MKKLAVLAAVLALSACNQPAAEEPTATETLAAEPAATETATAAWTGFEPGNYAVTGPKGEKIDYVLTADGYTATFADGKVETGTLVMKDGKGCMTPAGGEEMCFTNSAPDADGSWKATNDKGGVSTIMKKPA
jgi:hypothetical protein